MHTNNSLSILPKSIGMTLLVNTLKMRWRSERTSAARLHYCPCCGIRSDECIVNDAEISISKEVEKSG